MMRGEHAAIGFQVLRRRLASCQRFDRNRQRAVPERIETLRDLVDDRTGRDDVVIAELEVAATLEIFVSDVAPADDADFVVDDEELVVHPVVEPGRIGKKLGDVNEVDGAAIGKRIEKPQLDVRIPRERPDLRITAEGAGVVEQHADPHAPIGGLEQRFDQQLAGVVALDQEILHVQRSLGGLCHFHAQQEAVGADRE